MRSAAHNVSSWLREWTDGGQRRPALVDGNRRLSYSELDARVSLLAGALRARGVGFGDRVAILLYNRSEYLEAVLASARLGAICLPINTRLSPREIAFLFDDSQPAAILHEAELLDLVDRACAAAEHAPSARLSAGTRVSDEPTAIDDVAAAMAAASPVVDIEPVSPDDPMILMYTSGTTGRPKGALLPHRKALFNSMNAQVVFQTRPGDRVLVIAPLFHSLGLQIISLPVLYAGGCLVLHRRFEPAAVWRAVKEERITFFGAVPTMYRQLAQELDRHREAASGLGSLRFCFTAGAAVSVDLIRTYERWGLVLKQGYGQTETSLLCCLEEHDAIRKAGTVGRPLSHTELRLVDPDGLDLHPDEWREVRTGEVGEIVVRGPITMLGYWRRPEDTAQTLREGGWLRTNDLASHDDEGFMTLRGRARDMYISGGENVYPAEVEATYSDHPSISEIAVVGIPDPVWGEAGRAHVVLADGARLDTEDLLAWGRERLAKFKLPKEFVADTALPKTETGKVQKHLLSRTERDGVDGLDDLERPDIPAGS